MDSICILGKPLSFVKREEYIGNALRIVLSLVIDREGKGIVYMNYVTGEEKEVSEAKRETRKTCQNKTDPAGGGDAGSGRRR
jgi:hypothetical protein